MLENAGALSTQGRVEQAFIVSLSDCSSFASCLYCTNVHDRDGC